MISSIIDILYELVQKPLFWATTTAICATFINLLLFLINRKTFKLLYEKPHIRIKAISIATRHKSPDGMIPDGTYIDMEVINPSSFQNLLLNIKVSFFPFLAAVLQNEADIPIPPFSRKRLPISTKLMNIRTAITGNRNRCMRNFGIPYGLSVAK